MDKNRKPHIAFLSNDIRGFHLADLVLCICLLFLACLVITHIHDYGAGWDEPQIYDYAEILPEVYLKAMQGIRFNNFAWYGDLQYYGTAYFTIGEIGARIIRTITGMDNYDAWHILNFLLFLSGSMALYLLLQHFSSRWLALLSTLLYTTQPLFFGHAIINPKDGAFSSFFIISISLGMRMLAVVEEKSPIYTVFKTRLQRMIDRKFIWLVIAGFLIILVDRFGNNFILTPFISAILYWAIAWRSTRGFLESNFFSSGNDYIASRHSDYVARIVANLNFISVLLMAGLLIILFYQFIKSSNRFYRRLILAGTAVGLTASIRILGLASGLLILVMWAFKYEIKKTFIPAFGYFCVAGISMYLSWPFIWSHPLTRLVETIQFMSLPWSGKVLFNGNYYHSSSLPWNYLITLIPIQITLPILLFTLLGCGLALHHLIWESERKFNFILPFFWFFIPMIAWLIIRPTTYDNSRHFLFIQPALFIFSAIGLDWLFASIKGKTLKVATGLIVLMPGALAILLLHPYPYIYYNALVGWTVNIYNRFEVDYWGTSMCEAAKVLDDQIENSTRLYFTDQNLARLFMRCSHTSPQIMLHQGDEPQLKPDIAVILARWGYERSILPHFQPIYSISIGRTPLLVVRKNSS